MDLGEAKPRTSTNAKSKQLYFPVTSVSLVRLLNCLPWVEMLADLVTSLIVLKSTHRGSLGYEKVRL